MQGVIWIATLLAAFAAAALALSLLVDAGRRRSVAQAAAILAAVAAAAGTWLAARPAEMPWRLAAALSPALIWCAATWRRLDHTADWRQARDRRHQLRQVALHLVLVIGAVVFAMPFAWLVSTSLKPDAKLLAVPPEWIPRPALWTNYSRALRFLPPETMHGLAYLWNTIYISALSIIGTTLAASLVAYSFARLRWPGRDAWFVILLSTMMLPGAVTMIPVFLIFRGLGWVDTLRPLWVPAFFGGAFNVFLLRQFFLTIPTELEDAAKIDGAGPFAIYRMIMLPLIKPALAAVVIFTFMGSWNNFMGPLIYVSSPEKMPVAYALQLYQSTHAAEYNLLMAAATMVILPVVLVFFVTQRYFIQGVTLTGLKG